LRPLQAKRRNRQKRQKRQKPQKSTYPRCSGKTAAHTATPCRKTACALVVFSEESSEDSRTSLPLPFTVENGVLLTKAKNIRLRYLFRQTDAATFSPLFADALAWQLAAMLAGALMKGDSGAQQAARCEQFAEQYLARAQTADVRNRQGARETPLPPWLLGRR